MLSLDLICIILQSIVPAGFMPSSVATSGSFVEICPVQQPMLFQLVAGEHAHHHQQHIDQQSFADCDWGQGFFGLIAPIFFFLSHAVSVGFVRFLSHRIVYFSSRYTFIRGPPSQL